MCSPGQFQSGATCVDVVRENFKRKTIKHHARAVRRKYQDKKKSTLCHMRCGKFGSGRGVTVSLQGMRRRKFRTAQVAHRACPVSAAHLGHGAVGVRTWAQQRYLHRLRGGAVPQRAGGVRVSQCYWQILKSSQQTSCIECGSCSIGARKVSRRQCGFLCSVLTGQYLNTTLKDVKYHLWPSSVGGSDIMRYLPGEQVSNLTPKDFL